MTTKRRRAPAWTKRVHPDAFASWDGGRPAQEVMIHIYWSARGDARDAREGGRGHLMARDKITASLGLDASPDPGFTTEEMNRIAFAAKMEALRCLNERSEEP